MFDTSLSRYKQESVSEMGKREGEFLAKRLTARLWGKKK